MAGVTRVTSINVWVREHKRRGENETKRVTEPVAKKIIGTHRSSYIDRGEAELEQGHDHTFCATKIKSEQHILLSK